MEVVVTAVMGEIANRSISFLIDKYSKQKASSIEDQRLHNLRRLLQRVHVIIEEAEGRNITNQAMVHQLNMLRKEMYRGHFTMDNFRMQATERYVKSNHHDVSHPFAQSKFNAAKRLIFSTGDTQRKNELQQVLDNLNNIIIDASEFLEFLKNYSPRYRQPYSMHLFLEKSMFGRQMEMQRIMSFLMLPPTPSTKDVSVLPIIGTEHSGKSTLVAHICNHERVRDNFTQIVDLTEYDRKDRGLTTLTDGDTVTLQNSPMNRNETVLVIIEFSEDVDEAAWKRYLAYAASLASVVKIIITSRSSKITSFGTTEALILNLLPLEAYWYFFKVLTFDSADPNDQPKLESIAMEMCQHFNGSFVAANIFSGLLRADRNAKHWLMVRATFNVATKKKKYSSCAASCGVVNDKNPAYLRRMVTNDVFAFYPCYENYANDRVPKSTFIDVLYGLVRCEGRFEVFALKSRIPPYKNYMYTCEIREGLMY
ncbi:hypothetical protein ACP70R_015174 [Stipagrostis hirtigluma subsp. patula]